MGWAVKTCLANSIVNATWRGRCGLLILKTGRWRAESAGWTHLGVLGLHRSHGEELEECLDDAAWLMSGAPRGCKFLCVGDWNVDMAPLAATDPWASDAEMHSHHAERRALLSTWASAFKLHVKDIDETSGTCGGPWSPQVMLNP